jgi:transcriptional regulator with XRE-family HTH domain
LAEAAGLSPWSLRQWEQGRRTPLLDAAARIARALGVSLDKLVEGFPTQAGAAPEVKPARGKRGKSKGK